MSSLLEHIERLEAHRAAMGQETNGRLLAAFTQDRERSVEYWTDDAYADAMSDEHETALEADHRAFHAWLNARQRIRQGEARIAGWQMSEAWYALTEAWNNLVRGLFPSARPPQSAYALTPDALPSLINFASGDTFLNDIVIDGVERHGSRRRYLA